MIASQSARSRARRNIPAFRGLRLGFLVRSLGGFGGGAMRREGALTGRSAAFDDRLNKTVSFAFADKFEGADADDTRQPGAAGRIPTFKRAR